jgi:hypothetical protein
MPGTPTEPLRIVGAAIVVEGGLIVAALVGAWLLQVRLLATLQPSLAALGAGAAATVPLLVGLGWSVRTRFGAVARLKREVEEKVFPLFVGCSVLHVAAIALLAGIGEELLFRGLIQTATARWVGPWGGLLLASAAFGLAHPITPLYALLAGLIGLYLGGLFLATANLVVPVTAHTLYDFVALTYLVSQSRAEGRRRPPAAGDQGPGV